MTSLSPASKIYIAEIARKERERELWIRLAALGWTGWVVLAVWLFVRIVG